MGGGKGGAAFHAALLPIQRVGDVFKFDAVTKSHVPALFESFDNLVAVGATLFGPVNVSIKVGCGEQDVVDVLTVGSQAGIGARRISDQDRWVTHQLLVINEVLKDAIPRLTKVNVVVRDLRILLSRTSQEQVARGGVVQTLDIPWLKTEKIAVGHGQIGVQDHCIAGNAIAVGCLHRNSALSLDFNLADFGGVAKFDTVLGGSTGQSSRNRMHSALGHENTSNAVHVGDDGIDRECILWCQPGIHRLKREDALGAWVLEVLLDLGGELAEATDADQACKIRRD